MTGPTYSAGSSDPTVRLVSPYGAARSPTRRVGSKGTRLRPWIVHCIVLATSAFALLDLYLLGISLPH
jgi:hypothetical protein